VVVPEVRTQGESMEEEEEAVFVTIRGIHAANQNPWLPGYARCRGAVLEAVCNRHHLPPL